ncbi:MAG: type IX secretion system sortase PorU [Cyclobacteriaceae bacterium]|nr:type IX secretion system sortase PorU [Cyclobacteriaceae bacterium SS2]
MLRKLPAIGIFLIVHALSGQSILSDGAFYKIGVTSDGIYKIDASFLSSLGISPNSIDPKKIKIYGHNGGMLPQSNAEFVYHDPPENALIDFTDNSPGLGTNEYLLFYAQGPDKRTFGPDGEIIYEKNIYSDTAYYFLTIGNANGKRTSSTQLADSEGQLISHFNEFITRESEDINLIGSGRRWLGDEFSNQQLSKSFNYEIPGLRDSIHLQAQIVVHSEGKSSFEITMNGQDSGLIPFDSIPTGSGTTYTIRAHEKSYKMDISDNTLESIALDMKYNRANVSLSRAYLDYFLLSYERELGLYGNSTFFSNVNAKNGVFTYQIELNGANNATILDIMDPVNPRLIEYTVVNNQAKFSVEVDDIHHYVIFHGSDFPTPTYFGPISNQNIKAATQFDGLIITSSFESQAKKLQQFHQTHDNLTIGVINVNHIYNEFSSGRRDLTAIRNYIRYVYENGGRLKNVLLFGDCSYDYKYSGSDPNHIPVYESRDSFSPIYSYSSDDYLGFLEDHEGMWIENTQNDHDMEIGVGRIPAKTEAEADVIVAKILRYATSERTLGKWRNEIAYFADDGDLNVHMNHAVTLSNIVSEQGPQFRSRKIFLDNYEQIVSPRERSPAATKALEDAIADGLLVLNFIGHGNETQWMQEETLNNGVISQLTNRHKLPLIVTATCEFGKYDQPIITSGAEHLLLNPNGGAIALITTTRPVYAHTNLLVNKAFHEALLSKKDNEFPRLGDIIRETKNNSLSGPVNRNFALLGDPFLKLNYPKYDITFGELETISDTLSAFEEYMLYGAVTSSGDTIDTFNGKATVSIIDIPQQKTTRGQENPKFSYQELSNTLFRGEVSVTNGLFNASFILPKNISYKLEKGKVLAYAWDNNSIVDATGANTNIVIGGTIPNPVTDDTPPVVNLFLNDDTFISGQTVGQNSLFIARISDESGISISSNGFNQNITLTLNGGEPINLNDFYQANLDTYKSGTVLYPLQNLDPGKYSATLKIWDTYNNSSEKAVEFYVSDQPVIRLYNVMNYPNPVALNHSETTFTFEHDRQGEELIVNLDIYDMSGSIKFSSQLNIDDSQSKVDNLKWRPSNDLGGDLQPGIYLYRLSVKSTLDGASNEAIKRLVIIN